VLEGLGDLALDEDRHEAPDPRLVVPVVHPTDFVPDALDGSIRETALQAEDRKVQGLRLGWLHGLSKPGIAAPHKGQLL
jgi:hypothetical protein